MIFVIQKESLSSVNHKDLRALSETKKKGIEKESLSSVNHKDSF